MADRTDGWQVQLTEDWQRRSAWVVAYRRRNNGTAEVVTGLDVDGHAETSIIDEAENAPDGFALPLGVLEAIAEALKPGPSTGEVKRLEEALEVERRRVDRTLDRTPTVVGYPAPEVHT